MNKIYFKEENNQYCRLFIQDSAFPSMNALPMLLINIKK